MPEVVNTARPQKHLSLTLTGGSGDFNGHVSNILFANSTSQVTWQGGSPAALLADTVEGPWTAAITLAQDWENDDSLARFMLENAGDVVACVYKPHIDGDFTLYANITLVSPSIGGPVNAYNEATVTCGSSKPTFVAPAP